MDQNQQFGGGGNWNMISNFTSPNNTNSTQDPIFLSPQHQQQFQQQPQQFQQQQFQQQQPQFVHPSPQQQFMQQQSPQQFIQHSPQQRYQQQHSPFQQQQQHSPYQQQQIQHSPLQQQQQIVQQSPQQFVQQIQSPPPPQPQQQQQQQQNQSLASHFHLINLVENLADTIDNGTRDQQADAVISELNSQFEKCQQLLNSISGTINAKAMTVEGQKCKLEESEQLLNQRRDLISTYKHSVEELVKLEP